MATLLTTSYLVVDTTAQAEKVRIDIHRHIARQEQMATLLDLM